jgi:hypothetical protein
MGDRGSHEVVVVEVEAEAEAPLFILKSPTLV